METNITFGEYLRRLRRSKKWSLNKLAEESNVSYFYLSKLENDSTMPGAASVAKLAEVLDGDLKQMLQLADCLPKTILDRITARQDAAPGPSLHRTAGFNPAPAAGNAPNSPLAEHLQRERGLSRGEAMALASGVEHLLKLDEGRRRALLTLIESLASGDQEHGV